MASTKKTPNILKHYTSIENLFKILDSEELILGDPEKWSDKNDSAALHAFCKLKGDRIKARAICFLDGEESIYHWQFHAPKGCSISFDRDVILKQIEGDTEFLYGKVTYKREISAAELEKLRHKNIEKIPFIKRNQYKCEEEYRIIWFGTGTAQKIKFKRKPDIKSITLSPEIAEIIREKIQDHLKEKYKIDIVKLSRVLESQEKWISKFENLGKRNPKNRKTQQS